MEEGLKKYRTDAHMDKTFTYGKSDFLGQCVYMHHSRIPSTNDVLVIKNCKLRFELSDSVDWLVWTGEDETWTYVLILNATQSDPDIVARYRGVDLLLHLIVNASDLHDILVGHEKKLLPFSKMARFDFAHNDGPHVLVFFGYGDHKRGIVLSIYHRHMIQMLQEGWAARNEYEDLVQVDLLWERTSTMDKLPSTKDP